MSGICISQLLCSFTIFSISCIAGLVAIPLIQRTSRSTPKMSDTIASTPHRTAAGATFRSSRNQRKRSAGNTLAYTSAGTAYTSSPPTSSASLPMCGG